MERDQDTLKRNTCAEISQTNYALLGRFDELLNARKPDLYNSPSYLNYLIGKKFIFWIGLLSQRLITQCASLKVTKARKEQSQILLLLLGTQRSCKVIDKMKVILPILQCARHDRAEVQVNVIDPPTGIPV